MTGAAFAVGDIAIRKAIAAKFSFSVIFFTMKYAAIANATINTGMRTWLQPVLLLSNLTSMKENRSIVMMSHGTKFPA